MECSDSSNEREPVSAWTTPKECNETINNNIQRAQAIINEMNQSLNMRAERGLYDYFDRRHQESNMTKTDDGILEVIKRVTVLRDAWSQMPHKGAASGNAEMPSTRVLKP